MERFAIIDHGMPLCQFEYEFHISDNQNENATIIIKSGFGDKETTEILTNKILDLLNGKAKND